MDPLATIEDFEEELAQTMADTPVLESLFEDRDRQVDGSVFANPLELAPSLESPDYNIADTTKALQDLVEQYQNGKLQQSEVEQGVTSLGKQAWSAEDEKHPVLAKLRRALDNKSSFGLRNDPIGRLWNEDVQKDPALKAKYSKARGHKAKEEVQEGVSKRLSPSI